MSWLSRIINVFRSDEVDRELDEGLRFHVEARTEDLIASGVPREDALREASRRLGNVGVLRERSRDVRLLSALDALVRDLSFGVRMLRRDGPVSTAAIASLALAIGACTAAFALVDALILRPLPVREPSRLVSLGIVEDPARPDRTSFNYPLYQRIGEATRGRAALAAFSYQVRSDAAIDPRGPEERVYAQFASGNAFGLIGVTPALGRVLLPADDSPAADHDVAVLSYSFWMRRFGGDRSVVGRRLRLERNTYEIVGVARKGFTGVEPGIRTDFWVPLTSTATPESLTDPGWHWFKVLGRLEPGHSAEEVRDVMQPVLTTFRREVVAARWRPGMPTEGRDRYLAARMVVRPASNGLSDLRTNFERPLWILSAVVGLVLLLACSNLANLMLARAAARGREMALRLSIGAGRGRLVQQMLVEAGGISIAAVALGTLFARVTAPAIVTLLAPRDAPAYLDLHFDWRVLGFVAALGILATVAFGLVPALRASSTSPIDALKVAGGRSSTRIVLLRPLVAVQTAVGLAVLVLAGVLLLSFNRLVHVDAGFEADGVTLVSVELVNLDEAARGREAALMLLDQVRAVPGVKAAGLSKWPIMSGAGWNGWVRIPGRPQDDTEVYFLEITQGFVDAMRMRLLAGRDLARGDVDAEGEGPVLVNEAFARMYFPGVSPIGRRFSRPEGNRSGGGRDVPHEIVGLVADVKYNDLREAPPPMVYMPLRGPRPGDEMTLKSGTLEVRSSLPDDAVASAVRAAAVRVSPPMKVTDVTKQSTLVTNTLLRERLLALLSAFFALVSLALAGVGLYGVLSYSVVRQTREIGIRIALGATWRLIVQGLLGGISVYLAIGLATGLGAGLWLARFLGTLLYDVRPGDAATILLPLGLLLLVTLPAALLPARRAATVDPVVALRDE